MFDFRYEELLVAALIFLRVGGIFFALPIFGDQPTPVRVRILLSVAMTLVLYPIIPATWAPALTTDVVGVALMVVKELIVGLAIGFLAKVILEGLILAASLVGYQMGFGTAQLYLQDSDVPLDSFTAFHRSLVLIIFLMLNLHHMFIQAIQDTFVLIPAGAALPHAGLAQILIAASGGIFVTAIQLAAPVLIALMFTMAALGLMARTVPQLNVFTMSFPVSFFIGLLIYVASLPFYPRWITDHFEGGRDMVFSAIRNLSP